MEVAHHSWRLQEGILANLGEPLGSPLETVSTLWETPTGFSVSLKDKIHILAPEPGLAASLCSKIGGCCAQLGKAGWVEKNKESNSLPSLSGILGVTQDSAG